MDAGRLIEILTDLEEGKKKGKFNERVARNAPLLREVLRRAPSYDEVLHRVRVECDARAFVRFVTGYKGDLK